MLEPLPTHEPCWPQFAQGVHIGPQKPGRQFVQEVSGSNPRAQASHRSPAQPALQVHVTESRSGVPATAPLQTCERGWGGSGGDGEAG